MICSTRSTMYIQIQQRKQYSSPLLLLLCFLLCCCLVLLHSAKQIAAHRSKDPRRRKTPTKRWLFGSSPVSLCHRRFWYNIIVIAGLFAAHRDRAHIMRIMLLDAIIRQSIIVCYDAAYKQQFDVIECLLWWSLYMSLSMCVLRVVVSRLFCQFLCV